MKRKNRSGHLFWYWRTLASFLSDIQDTHIHTHSHTTTEKTGRISFAPFKPFHLSLKDNDRRTLHLPTHTHTLLQTSSLILSATEILIQKKTHDQIVTKCEILNRYTDDSILFSNLFLFYCDMILLSKDASSPAIAWFRFCICFVLCSLFLLSHRRDNYYNY